jgi:hypothetical protein
MTGFAVHDRLLGVVRTQSRLLADLQAPGGQLRTVAAVSEFSLERTLRVWLLKLPRAAYPNASQSMFFSASRQLNALSRVRFSRTYFFISAPSVQAC